MTEKQTLAKIEKNRELIDRALHCDNDPKLMKLLINRLSNKNRELLESLK